MLDMLFLWEPSTSHQFQQNQKSPLVDFCFPLFWSVFAGRPDLVTQLLTQLLTHSLTHFLEDDEKKSFDDDDVQTARANLTTRTPSCYK
jgi:hypothetical protein